MAVSLMILTNQKELPTTLQYIKTAYIYIIYIHVYIRLYTSTFHIAGQKTTTPKTKLKIAVKLTPTAA